MSTLDAIWLRETTSTGGRTWPTGWTVTAVEDTGSTNADLLQAAASGAPDRSVLVAAHQSAGRGRLDRRWEAPSGSNLLVSVLLRHVPEHVHEVTQRIAIAAAVAVEELSGEEPVLKWPNDLLLDGRKLAGVLAQTGARDGRVDHVVVGIGVNVGWAPDGVARVGPARGGGAVHPLDLLEVLLRAFDRLPPDIVTEYRRRLGTIGQQVRVERADGAVIGRAVDVERDGRLVVVDDCAITHRIDTGDVVHLRPHQG